MSADRWDRDDSIRHVPYPDQPDVVGGRHALTPRFGRLRISATIAATLVVLGGGAYVGGMFFNASAPHNTADAATVEPAPATTTVTPFESSSDEPGSASPSASRSPSAVASTRGGARTPTPLPATGAAGPEAAVVVLVNAERAKAGCSPLTSESRLVTAARGHAQDMAVNNYFSHTSKDGRSFATRISNAGYSWSGAAENIAMGQRDAADVMRSWMNSSGHKTNILNCGHRHIGVGLATNSGGQKYWVQDFASPRG